MSLQLLFKANAGRPIPGCGCPKLHDRQPQPEPSQFEPRPPLDAIQQYELGVIAANLALFNLFSSALFGPRGQFRDTRYGPLGELRHKR